MASAWAGVNSASVSERRRACLACAPLLSPKTLTPKGRADSDEPPGAGRPAGLRQSGRFRSPRFSSAAARSVQPRSRSGTPGRDGGADRPRPEARRRIAHVGVAQGAGAELQAVPPARPLEVPAARTHRRGPRSPARSCGAISERRAGCGGGEEVGWAVRLTRRLGPGHDQASASGPTAVDGLYARTGRHGIRFPLSG